MKDMKNNQNMNKQRARKFVIAFTFFLVIRIIAEPFVKHIIGVEMCFQLLDIIAFSTIMFLLNNYLKKLFGHSVPIIPVVMCQIAAFIISFISKYVFEGYYHIIGACIIVLSLVSTIFYFAIGFKIKKFSKQANIVALGNAFIGLSIFTIALLVLFLLLMSILYRAYSHDIVQTGLLMLSCTIEIYFLFFVQKVFVKPKDNTEEDDE